MRAEKQILLNEIKDKIDQSTALIVTRYEKLPPNGSWNLREQLGKLGCEYEVVRKRVFLKAAEQAGIQIDAAQLLGHIGVAFVSDEGVLPSAKVLLKYSEDNAKTIQFLLGKIDGKVVPGTEVEILARLPSLNELRAQFVGLLVAPMTHLLAVFDAAMAGPLAAAETEKN
jgi:large subunit ribosomal protein L10